MMLGFLLIPRASTERRRVPAPTRRSALGPSILRIVLPEVAG